VKNGKIVHTDIPWAKPRGLMQNLVVCINFNGHGDNESGGVDGFLQIKLPPIITVFCQL
jgi:hypothetical protein